MDLPSPRVLGAYVASRVGVPDRLVEQLDPTALPPNWRRDPAPRSVPATGDRWVAEGRSAVLRVPSAVVPSSPNYLVNPAHPDAGRLAVDGPFDPALDPRLR